MLVMGIHLLIPVLHFLFFEIFGAFWFKNVLTLHITEQEMKFPIKNSFNRFDQIHSFLWIWLHLLKKFFIENFIFRAVDGKISIQSN